MINTYCGYYRYCNIVNKTENYRNDAFLLLSKVELHTTSIVLNNLDIAIRCNMVPRCTGIYIISDDINIKKKSVHSDLIKDVIWVSTEVLNSIIKAYCIYKFSDRVYIGMADGLQARGGIGALATIGIGIEEIIRYGILFPSGPYERKVFVHLHNLFNLSQFDIYGKIGHFVYRRLLSKENIKDKSVYIYDYSGIGDVYVLCAFLKESIRKHPSNDKCLAVIEGACSRVARLCGIERVIALSEREMKMLVYYARIPGAGNNKLHVITPFPRRLNTDIYSPYLYGKRINMADAYRCVAFNLSTPDHDYPIIPYRQEVIDAFFLENNLREGRSVIISPYANTVSTFPMVFWERLAKKIADSGYDVCTNTIGEEHAIPGTLKVSFALEDAEHIVSKAGFFVGIRSGFCDIICNSTAQKCILYPDYEIFNSSLYDFCSFEKMGFGQRIEEICWSFDKYDELIEKVYLWIIGVKDGR